MKTSKKIIALCLAVSAGTAFAQQATEGNWMVRARGIYLDFDNDQKSGLPLNGVTKVKAEDRWIPEVDISYFFTQNIAAELVLTYPQKIDIKVGGHKEGTIKALPPSLLLQYHFTNFGDFKPYVGAGVNYTIFYNTRASGSLEAAVGDTDVSMSNSFGWALQAGADIPLNNKLFLNFDVKYIDMSTRARLNTTAIGQQSVRVDINPIVVGFGIGTRF